MGACYAVDIIKNKIKVEPSDDDQEVWNECIAHLERKEKQKERK